MDIRKVLFVGGDPKKFASVQIRCIDIASQLKCDYLLRVKEADEIPQQYSAFICIKPELMPGELEKLAKRGLIIWDIIDKIPPKQDIALYLTSNAMAQELFSSFGRVELLHHHHCNFIGTPNSAKIRRPTWIGCRKWLPTLSGFEFDYYDVEGMSREDVVQVCQKTGIGLNLRIPKKEYRPAPLQYRELAKLYPKPKSLAESVGRLFDFHLTANSGIKLINCIGFGIPSISSDEPAYHEIGENCTIFSSLRKCAHWVHALQNDEAFYNDLRNKCIQRAPKFHISSIAAKYKSLIESL